MNDSIDGQVCSYIASLNHSLRRALLPEVFLLAIAFLPSLALSAEQIDPKLLRERLYSDYRISDTTLLAKHCHAIATDHPKPILETAWQDSLEAIRAHALRNSGEWIRNTASIDLFDKKENQELSADIPTLLQSLGEPQLRVEVCDEDNITACTEQETIGNTTKSIVKVNPRLIENLCAYLNPLDLVAKIKDISDQSRRLSQSELATQAATLKKHSASLLATALIVDFKYSSARLYILAHEMTHIIFEPRSLDSLNNISRELRADMGASGMVFLFTPEEIVDKRLLPLDDDMRKQLHEFMCYAGLSTFLASLEQAGFADKFTGTLPPQQRREMYTAAMVKTHFCKDE